MIYFLSKAPCSSLDRSIRSPHGPRHRRSHACAVLQATVITIIYRYRGAEFEVVALGYDFLLDLRVPVKRSLPKRGISLNLRIHSSSLAEGQEE